MAKFVYEAEAISRIRNLLYALEATTDSHKKAMTWREIRLLAGQREKQLCQPKEARR